MKKIECILLPFGGIDDVEEYNQYSISHDWEQKRTEKNCIFYVCKRCQMARQNPSGTIDFHFGCSIMEFTNKKTLDGEWIN